MLQLVVNCNGVLDVVAATRVLVVVGDSAVGAGRELIAAYRFETFVGGAFGAARDHVREARRRVSSVGRGEHVLGLDARNEAGVAREALVADFVGGSVDPGLGILALIAQDECMLVELLSVVNTS